MNSTVELPVWLVILLLALAVIWLLQHLLLPSIRWFFRARANRVIDEVNHRLALKIPSFKLTKREVLIDRLCHHPQTLEMVDKLSVERGVSRTVLMLEVQQIAREIVPAFNALMYFKAAYFIARKVVHAIYRVRLGFADDHTLSELDSKTSVVFVMNHRSNMDYVLATYLAAERTALSYAVGEWARVWPLQQLIRLMGGYFVRRDSGDPLYRRVLELYVQMAAEGGVPQAVFPEGRLTRDGRLGEPKLGLLSYVVRGFDANAERDIVFIPVGINYDRVFEDRTQLRAAMKMPRRGKLISTGIMLRFVAKNLWQSLSGRRYRYGYACVNFGTPVSLKQWIKVHAADGAIDVSSFANELMQRIGNIIPILPVALVSVVMCRSVSAGGQGVTAQEATDGLSELELKSRVFALLEWLEARQHRAYIPRGDRDYAVAVGIRMLTIRHVIVERGGLFRVNQQERPLLAYYANSIIHLCPPESRQHTAEAPPGLMSAVVEQDA
jgi:glycerol-3-phosphate O-acyltransferase